MEGTKVNRVQSDVSTHPADLDLELKGVSRDGQNRKRKNAACRGISGE